MQNTAVNKKLVKEVLAAAKEVNRAAGGKRISFVCAEGADGDWQAVDIEEPERETERSRADKYWDKLQEIDDDFSVEVVYESCKKYIPRV